MHDERRTGRIPRRITTCRIGHSQTAIGERGTIRFALDEQAAGEFGNRIAFRVGHNKTVMFFGGDIGHGVENV